MHHSIQTSFEHYATIRDNLLLQLNRIFLGDDPEEHVKPDADGHISMADFVKKAPSREKIATLKTTLATAEALLPGKEEALEAADIALDKAFEAEAEVNERINDANIDLQNAQIDLQNAREQLDQAISEEAIEAAEEAIEAAEEAIDDANGRKHAAELEKPDIDNALKDATEAQSQAEKERNDVKSEIDRAKSALKRGFSSFSDCDESTAAYKFYGRQIIDEINKLTDYINEAQRILGKWGSLTGNNLSSLVHVDVVRLECLEQFCSEIHQKFGTRYYYDFDEDTWKLAEDDYAEYESSGTTYEQIGDTYDTYDAIYKTEVKCNDKGESQKTLECFNELNLLDRLKYINLYYVIKEAGATNYVFPGSKKAGYPCVAEAGIEDTDVRIARLEKFYLGYLIDRDGPINAFCSLYEVKVRALQETLNELKKRVDAFNVYLDFINRGLSMLNQSQSGRDMERFPVGAVIALTYLCGQNMYNLFEFEGEKYLVIPSVNDYEDSEDLLAINGKHYLLVKADDSGKNFLLGDQAKVGSKYWGNSYFASTAGNRDTGVGGQGEDAYTDRKLYKKNSVAYIADKPGGDVDKPDGNDGEANWTTTKAYCSGGLDNNGYYTKVTIDISDFKLPKRLDCANIDPKSVLFYPDYSAWTQDEDAKENQQAMINAWTKALKDKTQYIDNAIQNVNIDIEQSRNKINTYETQASTFRSRVYDVYVNTIRKTKA